MAISFSIISSLCTGNPYRINLSMLISAFPVSLLQAAASSASDNNTEMIHSAEASEHSSLPEKPPVHTSLVPCGLLLAKGHDNVSMIEADQIFHSLSGRSQGIPYRTNKNYIDWLFTDDFYVDNAEAIEFPYYISSECEAYIRPASTVLKSLEISKKVTDVYNTKDISRMQKFTF